MIALDAGGFGSFLLRILLLHQSDLEEVGRSLDRVMAFHDRAIRVMRGTRGGFSMMGEVGVDTPLERSF